MKYVVYLAIAALVLWAVVYLVRHIRRQLRGDCSSCGGDCGSCPGCSSHKHSK